MNKDEQELNNLIFYVALLEIRRGFTIEELVELTKLPISTINNYLNDKEKIINIFNTTRSKELDELLGYDYTKPLGVLAYEKIQENLQKNERIRKI